MVKKFCDKCGKDVTSKDHYILEIYSTMVFSNKEDYHLCPHCHSQLAALLKGGK